MFERRSGTRPCWGVSRWGRSVKDYYAAAAQIIPVLVLALLVQARITGSDQGNDISVPGHRVLAISLIGVIAFLAEGAALQVLLEGGQGSPHQAGFTALAITALTFVLFAATIAPAAHAWWNQKHKKLDRLRSRLPRGWEPWPMIAIAGVLMYVAYGWGEAHAPEEKQGRSKVERQGKQSGPQIHPAQKAKPQPSKQRD